VNEYIPARFVGFGAFGDLQSVRTGVLTNRGVSRYILVLSDACSFAAASGIFELIL
jgi:hypothetical protein